MGWHDCVEATIFVFAPHRSPLRHAACFAEVGHPQVYARLGARLCVPQSDENSSNPSRVCFVYSHTVRLFHAKKPHTFIQEFPHKQPVRPTIIFSAGYSRSSSVLSHRPPPRLRCRNRAERIPSRTLRSMRGRGPSTHRDQGGPDWRPLSRPASSSLTPPRGAAELRSHPTPRPGRGSPTR